MSCCSRHCRGFFFKQKTAYEVRISDWSSDACASDLPLSRSSSTRTIQAMDIPGRCCASSSYSWSATATTQSTSPTTTPGIFPLTPRNATCQLGRASGRERGGQYVETSVVGVVFTNNIHKDNEREYKYKNKQHI